MLMKPTRVSKLMTLDQNPPRLAGPGDSLAGRLVCIKECGGGLLAGEVWRAGFLVFNPLSKASKMLTEARQALKKGLTEMERHREAGLPAKLSASSEKPTQQRQLTIGPTAPG